MKAFQRALRDKPVPPLILTIFCLAMLWAITAPAIIHKTNFSLLAPTILSIACVIFLMVASFRRRQICLATAMSCDRGGGANSRSTKLAKGVLDQEATFAERTRERDRRRIENLVIIFALAKKRGLDAVEAVNLRYSMAPGHLVEKAKKMAGL